MTGRVRTACATAVALAVESADDPDIFKATIDLGNLEGMWALLFQRREEQQAQHVAAIHKAWRPLIDREALAAVVDQFRSRLGLTEARRALSDVASEALAAARNMLRALPDTLGWTKLRTAIRDAIAAGRTEGMVSAVAIAAQRADVLGLDWSVAFDHAYAALERLDELWADADGWLAKTLDRATADLGSMLADAAENGLTREEMIDASMDLLTADADADAVAFTVDWAMTTAADQGALDLYQSEGVSQIDIITAGDGRVCGSCMNDESGSPWSLGSAPRLPEHPLCRCCYAADVSLGHFASWFS